MIYAYVCDRCAASFNVKATLAEKERGLELRCPQCGSTEATQDLRGVGMALPRPGAGGPPCCPRSGTGCC